MFVKLCSLLGPVMIIHKKIIKLPHGDDERTREFSIQAEMADF